MSQLLRMVFFVSILASTPLILGQPKMTADVVEETSPADSIALDVERSSDSSLILVKASSCESLCNIDCGGECLDFREVGCSCYWVCENGSEGSNICGGAIGVSICEN